MNLDFTITKFRELCNTISNSGYHPLTIREYLQRKEKPKRFIILRHDIDIKPERAPKMAEIEKEFDLYSTYYFRTTDEVFQPTIIKRIAEMGHEVGYHYEVLDKARGDKTKAIEIFKKELVEFRTICNVETICMHGNTRTKWDNRDLWMDYDFKDYGIIGEAYLSIDFSQILYLSETGRSWSNKYKIKDISYSKYGMDILENIKSTDDVIHLIKQECADHIYLLSHPRWADSFNDWLIELISRNLKNVGKLGLKFWREKWKVEQKVTIDDK